MSQLPLSPDTPDTEAPAAVAVAAPDWGRSVWLGIVAGLILLPPYALTVVPGLQFGDGPELAAAAYCLGVPHPTGYPLYMILLRLWLAVTGSSEVILRTGLFNGLCMAAGCGAGAALCHQWLLRVRPQLSATAAALAAVSFGAASGLLRFHWAAAQVTEVYALQFLLGMVALAASWRVLQGGPTCRHWWIACAAAGLGLAHHRLALFPALVVVAVGVWRVLRATSARRSTLIGVAIMAAPLSLYGSLYFRAKAQPPINWGDTSTVSSLVYHARGGDYIGQRFMMARPGFPFTMRTYRSFMADQSVQLVADLGSQWAMVPEGETFNKATMRAFPVPGAVSALLALVTLVLAGFGVRALWSVSTSAVVIFGTAVVGNLLVLYLYNIPDIRDYELLPWWFISALAILGGVSLHGSKRDQLGAEPLPARLAWLWLALPLIVGMSNAPRARTERALSSDAELLAQLVLPTKDVMPTGSIMITGSDSEIYGGWYRQIVRKEREDVLLFGGNFIARPWYGAFFTPQQLRDYRLSFSSQIAKDPGEFVAQLRTGVIDANVEQRPIFTGSTDPYFLAELSKFYDLQAVLAASVVLSSVSDEPSTYTLYRLAKKAK